ncbi:MAG: helix-turn-helix domain-containing protein [Planctomycetia bacterium]|nr:helix-turn-helix domain-containing protein [Planctomycetia bacterium]
MANRLKMAIVQSVLLLHAQRWSGRRIARELHVNRETVSRYVRQPAQLGQPDPDVSNPANALLSRSGPGDPNPAKAPISRAGSSALSNPANAPILPPGRASDCDPWREIIQAKQAQGLSARRIHQDLVGEHGATVGYDSVRRFLRRLGWVCPLPFRRIERAPGEEAQVDFAHT